jgi:OFA family oxalate/formate antiporter-like MFS transporter
MSSYNRATIIAEMRSGTFLIIACAIGVACGAITIPFYIIGSLIKPISADLGWTRADIALAIIFSSGLGALTAPITGWMIDAYGARRIALPSLFGVALGLFIAAQAETPAMFYAGFFTVAILGAGTNPITWSNAIALNFSAARGLALGLALVGTGIAAIVLPQLMTALIADLGWRAAMMAVACLPIVIAFPIVFLWFKPSAKTGEGAGHANQPEGYSLREAVRNFRFWVLTSSILVIYLAISGVMTNLVPALTDRGLTTMQAAQVAGSIGLAMIIGRVGVGVLLDRFWAPGVSAIVLVLPALSCWLFQSSADLTILFSAAIILGLAAGAELDLLAFLSAKYFGTKNFAKIYAFQYAALAIGSASAPTLFARIYDINGSYDLAFYLAFGFFIFGGTILLTLGRYPNFSET